MTGIARLLPVIKVSDYNCTAFTEECKPMSHRPAKINRLKRTPLLASLLLVLCAAAPLSTGAQDGERRTRPRRVNGAATDSQPAATRPPAAPDAGGPVEVEEDDVLRVETQLIPVPVVVRDRNGKPVTNLRAESFALYEDGRPQRIANFATTDAPFEVALLLDTSGSTRAEVSLIRRAAKSFIDELRPGDRISLLSFNTVEDGGAKLAAVEVLTPLADDRDKLQEALERIGSSNGTPFYDALERVAKEVFREPPRAEMRGRRAFVALTDGVDSTSEAEFAEARAAIARTGALCYFIQVNTEDFVEERLMRDCQDDGTLGLSRVQLQRYRRIFAANADAADYSNFCRMGPFERMSISRKLYQLARQELATLARDTGGQAFTAADLRDARRAFNQLAADIGRQYSLGYYPTNKARDGRFRHIRVEVRGLPGAQVSAREGYQAPKG